MAGRFGQRDCWRWLAPPEGAKAAWSWRWRIPHEHPLGVVQQLPHGQCLNRHGQYVLARCGRDFCSACEARPDTGDFLFQRHHNFEVRRLRRVYGGGGAGFLNRAVADFRHASPEDLVRNRIDRDASRLCELYLGDIRFVHLDFSFENGHVRNGEQHSARIVHCADDDVLPLLDVAPRHDAVHRRRDDHLAQVVPRCGESGLLLLDLLLASAHLLLASPEFGLAQFHFILRALQCLARG